MEGIGKPRCEAAVWRRHYRPPAERMGRCCRTLQSEMELLVIE